MSFFVLRQLLLNCLVYDSIDYRRHWDGNALIERHPLPTHRPPRLLRLIAQRTQAWLSCDDASLAERGQALVTRVAKNAEHSAAVPVVMPFWRGDLLVLEFSSDLAQAHPFDRDPAKHLSDDTRLIELDIQSSFSARRLSRDIPITVRRVRQHAHRSTSSRVLLAAS